MGPLNLLSPDFSSITKVTVTSGVNINIRFVVIIHQVLVFPMFI